MLIEQDFDKYKTYTYLGREYRYNESKVAFIFPDNEVERYGPWYINPMSLSYRDRSGMKFQYCKDAVKYVREVNKEGYTHFTTDRERIYHIKGMGY